MGIIILKALLALSLFAMLFIITFYLGFKYSWDKGWEQGWEQGWDAREEGRCKGCVCYSFTVNALQDYYDEPFKDHDQHPFDPTEFDKYMDLVNEQVDKLKEEIEDDDDL